MLNVTDYYEKANQTAGRYHCTPVSVASLTKQKTTSVGKDMDKLEPSCTAGRKGK